MFKMSSVGFPLLHLKMDVQYISQITLTAMQNAQNAKGMSWRIKGLYQFVFYLPANKFISSLKSSSNYKAV